MGNKLALSEDIKALRETVVTSLVTSFKPKTCCGCCAFYHREISDKLFYCRNCGRICGSFYI